MEYDFPEPVWPYANSEQLYPFHAFSSTPLPRSSNTFFCKIEIKVHVRDGPLEKLWGGRGIFEPQEIFSLSNSLYEFILGQGMNIF